MGLVHEEKWLVELGRREKGEVACGGSKSKNESWSSHNIALPQCDWELVKRGGIGLVWTEWP